MVASTPILDSPDQTGLFSRPQIMSRIIELNPTTTAAYLASFSDESLHRYLTRLSALQQPRLASKGWVRAGAAPAIICREPLD